LEFEPQQEDIPEFSNSDELIQCRDCQRKFRKEALLKHAKVCKKVFVEKRKPFDSKQTRLSEELQDFEKKKQQSDKSSLQQRKSKQPS